MHREIDDFVESCDVILQEKLMTDNVFIRKFLNKTEKKEVTCGCMNFALTHILIYEPIKAVYKNISIHPMSIKIDNETRRFILLLNQNKNHVIYRFNNVGILDVKQYIAMMLEANI